MHHKTLISPQTLALMQDNEPVVVIDTRDPEEYAKGHIPGAVNIREIFTYLASTDSEGLEAMKTHFAELFGQAGLSGKETAVLYEDAMNTGFGQSCRGYLLLQSLGYPKACILHGGLRAWTEAGLPLSEEAAKPQAAAFPLNDAAGSVMVNADEMLAALDDPDIVILDVRDREEWEGLSSSPYGVDFCPRKGRLPGAVWIEWYRLMDEPPSGAPTFRPAEELREALDEVGIDGGKPVYVYCFKGARASNTLVGLKEAGIENAKVYFGSWNEWSRDPALPIDARVIE